MIPYPEDDAFRHDSRNKDLFDLYWGIASKHMVSVGLNPPRSISDAVNAPGVLIPGQAILLVRGLDAFWTEIETARLSITQLECGDREMQFQRSAISAVTEGIIRTLIGTRAGLDAHVIADIADWEGVDYALLGAVCVFFERSTKKTLRSVEPWLRQVAEDESRGAYLRAGLLMPIARLDPDLALRVGRELFDAAPWGIAGLFGRFGGQEEADLLVERLPSYRVRGQADTRKRMQSAIRKIEKRAQKGK